ncbi:MAG TPA: hypothetical protein VMR43_16520 [Variovorax sp.]|nr:hypothetical protein [Variovorax sp.]
MKGLAEGLSPAQMREQARAWYEKQIEVIALAHGSSWPTHRDWVDAYLREEIRERLLELGWRPKQ